MTRRDSLAALAGAALAVAPASAAGLDRLTPLDEAGFQKLVASHKGKVLLVDFWATWCEPCRKEMPLLVKLEAKLKSRGFAFVTVSADEPEDAPRAIEFLKMSGVAAPAYLKQAKNDEKFINSIETKWSGALPAAFLFDRTGKKVKSLIGETEIPVLEAAIAKLL
jgi:thiol-disulfide isomerase/thioredoxin